MAINSLKYNLLSDSKTYKDQFKEILFMLQYNCIASEDGICNSRIQIYKSQGIKRFIIYVEVKELNEELLFEIFNYYIKKYRIKKNNTDIFIIIDVTKTNDLTDYFLDCFMEFPDRFNNMHEIVPIVIDNTKRIVYVGNNNRDVLFKEVHSSTYLHIQNDIKDFMNLYYMMNNSRLEGNCNEIILKKDKQKVKKYKVFSKNYYIINLYNIKKLKLPAILLDILNLLGLVLIIYILQCFPDKPICIIISVYIKIILFSLVIAFILNCILRVKYFINCNKMKINNFDTFKDDVIKFLEKSKYKRIADNMYKKYNKTILFLNDINEISKYNINIKNTLIFLLNSDNLELDKFNKKYFIVTLLKDVSYICIHKKCKFDKRMKELLKIMSFLYYKL